MKSLDCYQIKKSEMNKIEKAKELAQGASDGEFDLTDSMWEINELLDQFLSKVDWTS